MQIYVSRVNKNACKWRCALQKRYIVLLPCNSGINTLLTSLLLKICGFHLFFIRTRQIYSIPQVLILPYPWREVSTNRGFAWESFHFLLHNKKFAIIFKYGLGGAQIERIWFFSCFPPLCLIHWCAWSHWEWHVMRENHVLMFFPQKRHRRSLSSKQWEFREDAQKAPLYVFPVVILWGRPSPGLEWKDPRGICHPICSKKGTTKSLLCSCSA